MVRVGLVLGAGGVVGQAYQAGVLAVLEHECGFDARNAEVIVGTSAGAITGTLLRLGVSPENLAAWTARAPLSGDHEVLRHMARTPLPDLEPLRPMQMLLRPPQPPGWEMVRRAVVRPWHFRPLAAGLALLGPGRHDIVGQLAALRALGDAAWPEDDLWLCAVRRRDGRRVVFGRPGAPEASLHLAVAASCAVPGYFAPVHIDHHSYVDGGAHSPTNAAILRRRPLDLVIIVSPMSGPPGSRPDFYAAARRHAGRLLRREVRALKAAGVQTLVFSPGATEQEAMGNDVMSRHRLAEVIQRSYLGAGAYAATPAARKILQSAATARSQSHGAD